MKHTRASVRKARRHSVIDEMQAAFEPVIVPKRGKPVVKAVGAKLSKNSLFGFMTGKFKIVGDIEAPIVPLKLEDREEMPPL